MNLEVRRSVTCVVRGVAALVLAATVHAQAQPENFKARLSTMPVENARLAVLAGSGSATATLAGRTLTVRGTFEGMKSPVTVARIHLGPRGIRGPAMFDLTIVKSATEEGSGTIAGTFTVTPEQAEAVRSSRFYLQLNGEKSQDGGIWGWLIPQG
jgi:hypothetical protein